MVAAAITTKDMLSPISTMTDGQGPLSPDSAASGWGDGSRASGHSKPSTTSRSSRIGQEKEEEEDMEAFGGGCAIFSPRSWAGSGCGGSEKADERVDIVSDEELGKPEDDVASPRSRCSCGGSSGVIDVDDGQVALPRRASSEAQPLSPGSMASDDASPGSAASPGPAATDLVSPRSAGSNPMSPGSMTSDLMSPGSMASGTTSDAMPPSSVLSGDGPFSPMSVFSGETRDSNESAGLKSLLCASDDDDDECVSHEFSFEDPKKKEKGKKGKKRREKKVAFVEKNPTPLSPWSYSFEDTPKSRSEVSMTESMLSPRQDDEETLTLEDTLGDDEETCTLDETLDETLDGPGLLSRSGKRSLHKPKPKKVCRPARPDIVEIADDESESSMMVLMRYMGCTPVAYGEGPRAGAQWLDDAPASSASGKEFVFGSFDDDNSLVSEVSYMSCESQGDIKNSWTMRNEEVGVEIGLEDVMLASQLPSPRSKGKPEKKKRGKDKGKEKKKDKKVGKVKSCKMKKTTSKKRNLTVETDGAKEVSSSDAINAKRKARIKMLLKEKGLDNVLTDAELRAFLDDDGVETSGSSDEVEETEDEAEEDEDTFTEDDKNMSFTRKDATAKDSESSDALKKYRSGVKSDVEKPENLSSPALRKYRKEVKATKRKGKAVATNRKGSAPPKKCSDVSDREPRQVKAGEVFAEEVNSKNEPSSPSSVHVDGEDAREVSELLTSNDASLPDGIEAIEAEEAGDAAKPPSPKKMEPLSPSKNEPPLYSDKREPVSSSKRGPSSPVKKKPTSLKGRDPTSPEKKEHPPGDAPLPSKGDAQAASLGEKADALETTSISGVDPVLLEKKAVAEKKAKKPASDRKATKSSKKSPATSRKKKSSSPLSATSGSVGEAALSPTSVKSDGSNNKKKTIKEQGSIGSATTRDLRTTVPQATSHMTSAPVSPTSPATRNSASGVTVDEVAASASDDSRELRDLIAGATAAAEVALSKSANRLQPVIGDTGGVDQLEESPTTRSDKENSSSDDGATAPHLAEAPATASSAKAPPLTIETSTPAAQHAETQASSSGILGQKMLSPSKQSVREVDALLNKTRAWLDRHNESKLAKQASRPAPSPSLATPLSGERQVMGNITARIGPGNNALKSPSLMDQLLQSKEGNAITLPHGAGPVSLSSLSGSSSMSPSMSTGPKKSILEQLGEIRAKQRELEQRQTLAKSKKNGAAARV